jgi:A/G-specific adenine glycosylase
MSDIEDLAGAAHARAYHRFQPHELDACRRALLAWYAANRRRLPWRGDAPPFGRAALPHPGDEAGTASSAAAPKSKSKSTAITSFFKPNVAGELAATAATAAAPAAAAQAPQAHVSPPPSSASSPSESVADIFPLRPWPNAYATWVSEIMLQQTRVETVVAYFERWMRRFPTVHALAAASPEDVNAHWAGLGYYRRARFLHEGAKRVVATMHGELPSTAEALKQIPGIGEYTAGAIASIAFDQRAAIVDGNVIRVMARLRALAVHPKHKLGLRLIWDLAADLVEGERPGDLNQALMELGATVCTPKSPVCGACPVADVCRARAESERRTRPATAAKQMVQYETAAGAAAAAATTTTKRLGGAELIVIDDDGGGDGGSAAGSSSLSPRKSITRAEARSSSSTIDDQHQPCGVCDESTLAAEAAALADAHGGAWAVTRFPLRAERKVPREEVRAVCLVTRRGASSAGDSGEASVFCDTRGVWLLAAFIFV